MAKKKSKGKFVAFLMAGIGVFVLGFVLGFGGLIYLNAPQYDELKVNGVPIEQVSDTFYHNSDKALEIKKADVSYEPDKDARPAETDTGQGSGESSTVHEDLAVENAGISIHFLELGNKYTGDCTYIKTDTCDILIDCGSKATSVPYVSAYLNQYVTDGTLEYVIITHAHEDHYAGFATSKFEESIFGLYQCDTIITFSQTNQKPTSTKYKNYTNNLNKEIEAGAHHYTTLECINSAMEDGTAVDGDDPRPVFTVGSHVTMTIVNSLFYTKKASTENDYSVCTLFTYSEGDHAHNYFFSGDLEKEGEDWLADNANLPANVDLYKAGHHGSKTSSNVKLMAAISPKTICVCCCAGSPEYTKTNENQFPTQDFVNRIAQYTADVYVTTLCLDYKATDVSKQYTSMNGNIVFLAKLDVIDLKFSNNAVRLKDTEWFKQNRTMPEAWRQETGV